MIKVIKAEEKHVTDICRLWLEFMKFHTDFDNTIAMEKGFYDKGIISASGMEEKFLRPAMKSKNSLVQVALNDEKVIGYSVAGIRDIPNTEVKQCGFIDHLYITKNYRRQGIGEKLYEEIIKWFRSRDISIVEIQLLAKNEVAYSFWRKHGYGDYQHIWIRRI